jgi:CBS domain-containing protein
LPSRRSLRERTRPEQRRAQAVRSTRFVVADESRRRDAYQAPPALLSLTNYHSALMPLVANHMSRDLLTVRPDIGVAEAARRMDERGVGAVLVLEGGRLVGILTERDVLRAVARGAGAAALVAEWMTHHPETIQSSDTTEHATVIMIHGGFRHLPVVEAGVTVGMLSIRDVMKAVLDDSAPRGA